MPKFEKRKENGKSKDILINVIILLVTLFVCFILFEIFLRIFLPQNLNYADFDTKFGAGYKLRSNFHAVYTSSEYVFKVDTNSKGLREDIEYDYEKPEGIKRIIILGDSMGFGYTVNIAESYPKQLEKILGENGFKNTEVINAGVPGYSTYKELMYFKNELYRYNPDIVIVSLTVSNDISANIDDEQNTKEVIRTLEERKPFWGYINLRIRKFASSNLHSFQFVRAVLFSNPKIKSILVKIGLISKYAEFDPKETDYKLFANNTLENDRGMNATIEILKEMNKFGDEINTSLIIVPIPRMEQVNLEYFNAFWKNYPAEEIDVEKPQRILAGFAKSEGIGYIDPLSILREKDLNNSFFWNLDMHMNAQGYKILAELTYDELAKNYKDKIN